MASSLDRSLDRFIDRRPAPARDSRRARVYMATMLRSRALAPLLLAALTACGAPAAPLAPPAPTAAPPVSAAPTASVEAPAPAPSYVLQGTLLGHDGRPLKLAHVHVGAESTPVDAGGAFRVTARGPGFLPVRFTGVDHADLDARLYFDGKEGRVTVTLGTWERNPAPFADAMVVVYLRDKGGALVPLFRRPVHKLAGGLSGAALLEKSEEIYYALEDVARGHRCNGVEAESFAWDGRSSYIGQLHRTRGAFRITLDAARMPPAGRRPQLRFDDPGSRGARVTTLAFEAALRAEDEAARGPQDPGWRAEITRALASERDPEVSAALRLAYLVPPGGLRAGDAEAAGVARALLDQLPAGAPLWAFAPGAALTAVELAGRAPEREAYLDRLLDGLADADAAAAFLGARLRGASRAGRDGEAARLLALMHARFAGTPTERAVSFYDPARKARPGRALPDFDLPALRDGPRAPAGARVTRADLRGKVALLDFWGIWCGPCVAEMRNLHEVFARYHDAGFTIVSVAVRSTVPTVQSFRQKRWPMPWSNVVLDDATQDDVLERFEIKSFPAPILVGADGVILEAGDDLRGEALGRAVAAALRARPAP
jgi:thiol-disulfide isomerase/thioredoxin